MSFRYYLLRFFLFGSPFLLLSLPFFLFDPFGVLYRQIDFSPIAISSNMGFISTEIYLRQRNTQRYSAFIFGNSKTLAIRSGDWGPFIDSSNSLRFDAVGENLPGILSKLKFIDQLGDTLKHVLLLLDYDIIKSLELPRTHSLLPHPALTGMSWTLFRLEFFKAYWHRRFLPAYLDYILSGGFKAYMKGVLYDDKILRDSLTNDILLAEQEEAIAREGKLYWDTKALNHDLSEEPVFTLSIIDVRRRIFLDSIRAIFDKHGTQYRIIISPGIAQINFNRHDLAILRECFGSKCVFDFSGTNNISIKRENFYEKVHFRPTAGKELLGIIYGHR